MELFCSISMDRSRKDSSRDEVCAPRREGERRISRVLRRAKSCILNAGRDSTHRLASQASRLVRQLALEQLLNERLLGTLLVVTRRGRSWRLSRTERSEGVRDCAKTRRETRRTGQFPLWRLRRERGRARRRNLETHARRPRVHSRSRSPTVS